MTSSSSRIIIRNLPPNITEKQIESHLLTNKNIQNVTAIKLHSSNNLAFVGFRTSEEASEALTYFHNTYVRTRKIQVEAAKIEKVEATSTTKFSEEDDPTRLFIRNLPYNATEDELLHFLNSSSDNNNNNNNQRVKNVHVAVDDLKRNKGFAFANCVSKADAKFVLDNFDKTDFQGRLLHILPAKYNPKSTTGSSSNDPKGYKAQKEVERREKAENDTAGWSASFVRGDTVVDGLADRLGVKKGDILDIDQSSNVAVKMALGETHIVKENQQFFAGHGIDIDSLVSKESSGKSVERSKTMFLVKNLPYDSTEEELMKIFSTPGEVSRILLPPSKAIACIEYGHPSDAKKAFKNLAYRRFKSVPLYLEWAPIAAFLAADNSVVKEIDVQAEGVNQLDDDEEEIDEDAYSIFVKNLNFETTEEELERFFDKVINVRAVKIPTKQAPEGSKHSKLIQSMGFGFVECENANDVRKAIKLLNGKVLAGHQIDLKVSSKKLDASALKKNTSKNERRTKLMVRNVPFQANKSEIAQLFGSVGKLKKVRLPKKFDGTSRGFAFVEFLTAQEASNAKETLSKTHLYGRHLVIEWADKEDDVDTLRLKAKRDIVVTSSDSARKNKKIKFNEE